jgi:hypothetical protein
MPALEDQISIVLLVQTQDMFCMGKMGSVTASAQGFGCYKAGHDEASRDNVEFTVDDLPCEKGG